MLNVTDEALRGFDNNMATIVIFLDLSAAFDTIDIDRILEILQTEIGVDGVALQWFKSFLTGRTQRVKISGVYSESCEVPFGAPQGSVLGPKLFNINVRSQPVVFKKCCFNLRLSLTTQMGVALSLSLFSLKSSRIRFQIACRKSYSGVTNSS